MVAKCHREIVHKKAVCIDYPKGARVRVYVHTRVRALGGSVMNAISYRAEK